MLQNIVKLLSAKCDSNERYSHRVLLRINNIPLPANDENKTVDDNLAKVRYLFDEAEIDIPDNCIDRVHRVGKLVEADDGTRKQQVIVKSTTWHHIIIFIIVKKAISC